MIYSKPPRLIFLRLLLILLLAFPSPAFAATRTWSAAQADNWPVAVNWSDDILGGFLQASNSVFNNRIGDEETAQMVEEIKGPFGLFKGEPFVSESVGDKSDTAMDLDRQFLDSRPCLHNVGKHDAPRYFKG